MSFKKKEEVKETTVRFGFEVKGKIKVFAKQKEITLKNGKKKIITENWTNVSRKIAEGDYKQVSMPVKFSEELGELTATTDLIVSEAFLTLSGGEGYERITLFVLKAEEA